MKDLKFQKILRALGGAPCLLCDTQVDDCTKLEKIEEGFPITRSAEETENIYNTLRDENGEVIKSPKDFETRKGLTQKPITTSDQRNITILHAYINGVAFFIKFLARIECPHQVWMVHGNYRGDPVREAERKVIL